MNLPLSNRTRQGLFLTGIIVSLCGLLVDNRLSSMGIIILVMARIISGNIKGLWLVISQSKYFLICAGFFIVYLTGYFFSDDKVSAGLIIEKNLSFIIIPLIIFSSAPLSHKYIQLLLKVFVFCTIGMMLFCLLYAANAYLRTSDIHSFFYHALTKKSGLSAIHASYFCVLGWIFLSYTDLPPYIKLAFHILFIIFLLLLSSKIFLFITLLLTVMKVIKGAGKKRIWMLSLLLFLVAAVFMITNPVKQRFKDLATFNLEKLLNEQSFETSDYFDGLSLRVLYLRFGIELLQEHKAYLWGVGTGDAERLLREKILESRMYRGIDQQSGYLQYGYHNQYLQVTVRSGLIGLALFLMLLALCWYISVIKKNYLLLSFMLVFTLACCTDTWLDVQKGLVSFLLLTCLMIRNPGYTTEH